MPLPVRNWNKVRGFPRPSTVLLPSIVREDRNGKLALALVLSRQPIPILPLAYSRLGASVHEVSRRSRFFPRQSRWNSTRFRLDGKVLGTESLE